MFTDDTINDITCDSGQQTVNLDTFKSINTMSTITGNAKIVTTTVCYNDQRNCFTFTEEERIDGAAIETMLGKIIMKQTEGKN